jgi:effector-binding domain-containing protein
MNFTLVDIRRMITDKTDDAELAPFLMAQKQKLSSTIDSYQKAEESLNTILEHIERTKMNTKNVSNTIEEKTVEDIIFAGYRFKGKYSEAGTGYKRIGRAAGRFIAGPAMMLFYDSEYRETDADIEAGFPLSKQMTVPDINCRILPGGKAVTLVHHGVYETLGKSYEKIFAYIESKKFTPILPSREIYLKGPGMIFRGNPEKYLTEIQLFIK